MPLKDGPAVSLDSLGSTGPHALAGHGTVPDLECDRASTVSLLCPVTLEQVSLLPRVAEVSKNDLY